MKLSMLSVLFTATLSFVGCVSESPESSVSQKSEAQAEVQSAAESVEAASCASAGGVCRKSACRTGEVFNEDLECGTDAACCVPVR